MCRHLSVVLVDKMTLLDEMKTETVLIARLGYIYIYICIYMYIVFTSSLKATIFVQAPILILFSTEGLDCFGDCQSKLELYNLLLNFW